MVGLEDWVGLEVEATFAGEVVVEGPALLLLLLWSVSDLESDSLSVSVSVS